jgi:hypothetical protein
LVAGVLGPEAEAQSRLQVAYPRIPHFLQSIKGFEISFIKGKTCKISPHVFNFIHISFCHPYIHNGPHRHGLWTLRRRPHQEDRLKTKSVSEVISV